MGLISISDLSDGTGADANDINSRFATVLGLVNGNIDNANIAAGGITTSNLATSSVTTDKIADANVTPTKLLADTTGHAYMEIGRTTLSVAGDTIDVTVAGFKYLRIVIRCTPTGGTISHRIRFNGDTGNNYDQRSSTNGAADATSVSQSAGDVGYTAGAFNMFTVVEVTNTAGKVKDYMGTAMANATAAGTASGRREVYGKWANASVQATTINVFNDGTGNYDAGSEVVVYGHN